MGEKREGRSRKEGCFPSSLMNGLALNSFPFTFGRLDLGQLNACLKFKVGTTKYM